eukprot:1275823-Amphidinium_carterae.1
MTSIKHLVPHVPRPPGLVGPKHSVSARARSLVALAPAVAPSGADLSCVLCCAKNLAAVMGAAEPEMAHTRVAR